jgi:hypothetical protein
MSRRTGLSIDVFLFLRFVNLVAGPIVRLSKMFRALGFKLPCSVITADL